MSSQKESHRWPDISGTLNQGCGIQHGNSSPVHRLCQPRRPTVLNDDRTEGRFGSCY